MLLQGKDVVVPPWMLMEFFLEKRQDNERNRARRTQQKTRQM